MGVTRMSVFCGLVALLLLSGSHLSHAASVLKPKECDGIKTPVEYVERLEAIFDGDERGASVCEDTLFGRTDQFWEGNELPESLSKNSLMWVFVSDSTVLNKFLDFASQECSGDGQCDREALIVRMMNYAGFDTGWRPHPAAEWNQGLPGSHWLWEWVHGTLDS